MHLSNTTDIDELVRNLNASPAILAYSQFTNFAIALADFLDCVPEHLEDKKLDTALPSLFALLPVQNAYICTEILKVLLRIAVARGIATFTDKVCEFTAVALGAEYEAVLGIETGLGKEIDNRRWATSTPGSKFASAITDGHARGVKEIGKKIEDAWGKAEIEMPQKWNGERTLQITEAFRGFLRGAKHPIRCFLF
jgi:hypothetical protein